MSTRIKTNIKFYKGLDNVADKLYGFVTKVNGSWRGCRDDVAKKKIVFLDSVIAPTVLPNVLYSCSLIPMRHEDGFIAKSATLIQFDGQVITRCRKSNHSVLVRFGNRLIIYDPSSKEKRKRDIQKIADNIRSRVDLKNANAVAEEFIDSACMVKRLYDQSLGYVS